MVYILTFQRALNYGAILQCYALYKTISGITDCRVLEYSCYSINKRYRLLSSNLSIKNFLKALLMWGDTLKKKRKFSDFISQNIKMTKSYTKDGLFAEIWKETDQFVVGSDQVWNWELTEEDSTFFFDFVPESNCKISYAASIGLKVEECRAEYFKQKLTSFKAISVRESTAYDNLKSIGISCIESIDPVFLLNQTDWEDISTKVEKEDIPYVLIYLLQKNDSFEKKAVEYAKSQGKRLVIISNGVKRKYKAEYISSCAPNEFIRYFLKAETIFTNSFHGISFSVLFKKDFFYELQGNGVKTNSRLNDIVELFGLQSRDSSKMGEIGRGKPIDYGQIGEITNRKRNEAIGYLSTYIYK